ncbi:unnamed protein product [Penicillium crustosum]
MHRLRDSLLSPSPKGFPDIGELDSVSHNRQDTRESLARGEFQEVHAAARYNRTWILSLHASHETFEHDRLVLDIIRIQGMGPLTRTVKGIYEIDIARTTEGTIWNDLPFLVTDMTDFWINNCGPMSGTQRLNFASFLAKLASTRVCKDRICQVALVIFRCAFEQRQEILPSEDKDEEDSHRSMGSLELRHLLPAANAWFKEASHNIMQLSEVSWNYCPSAIGQGGPSLLESELGKRSPTGFTLWRWMYWLKRLNEIEEEAKRAGEKRLEYANEAIHFMVTGAEERNSDILRVFKTAGDSISEDKHFLPLK